MADLQLEALPQRSGPTAKVIMALLVALVALQCLDWYSTLTAGATQSESNPLLLGLAKWLSLPCALTFVKVAGTSLIAVLAYSWTRVRGRYDAEFLACLTIVASVYAAVVFNNFLSRGGAH